jgi:AraC-like DNA-binding protein
VNNIGNLIELIESRLTEDLTVTELAEQAFFSKTHYQRLFRATVGEPVMEYIKNRRLQLACRELLETKAGVLDTALKYGYGTHEGFTRAFKAYFNTTPAEYRKNRKILNKEETEMLSNEVLNRIGQNAEKISAKLSNFVEKAERLTTLACKTAEEAGYCGAAVIIAADELRRFAKRVSNKKENCVKGLVSGNVSAFGMMDKIFELVKYLEDAMFQMTLLLFLSGIETGRTGEHRARFEPIHEGYVKLQALLLSNKANILALTDEAIGLIHADINAEAENRLKAAAEIICNAVKEGTEVASDVKLAADNSGEQGRVLLHIANGISARTIEIKGLANSLSNTALARIADLASYTNIDGFNATIEAARVVGNAAECSAAEDKIKKYAGVLHKTYAECEELLNEHSHLIKLTQKDNRQDEKWLDDFIFQCNISRMQLSVEAERVNNDSLRELVKHAEKIQNMLVETRDFKGFVSLLSNFTAEFDKVIATLTDGGSFVYMNDWLKRVVSDAAKTF